MRSCALLTGRSPRVGSIDRSTEIRIPYRSGLIDRLALDLGTLTWEPSLALFAAPPSLLPGFETAHALMMLLNVFIQSLWLGTFILSVC